MRGVISLAAAFALSFVSNDGSAFPGRNYILFLTFQCDHRDARFFKDIRKLGIEDDGSTD